MGMPVMGSNLLRTKLDFVFVRFVSLELDINLKLRSRLDKF